jgi:tRNA(Ile)-lysidine synthase
MDKEENFKDRFSKTMQTYFAKDAFPKKIAVAVSGGADSMALVFSLANYVGEYAPETQIYALSVDHRLREEAAEEARFVGKSLSKLPNVSHQILVWEQGSDQETRIEERARAARYGLLFGFMVENDITHLFIGHHQNDQAETFLFRLAKGSGLDGLACMPEMGETFHNGYRFMVCRPLLGEKRTAILDYVAKYSILYIEDPSNQDEQYARVRLRKSMAVLSKEGLTSKRLDVTSKRIRRARDAIVYITDIEYKKVVKTIDTDEIVLYHDLLVKEPLEIVIRIILKAIETLKDEPAGYGPRLERVEKLCEDLMQPNKFRKRTLHGIIFEHKAKSGEVVLSLEW